MGVRHRIAKIAAVGFAAMVAAGASAQFSDSFNFMKAVRDRDGKKAEDIMRKPSPPINVKDYSGDTPMTVLTRGRDLVWMNYLLSNGAKPDIRDGNGDTPLGIAAQIGFVEGARLLIQRGAQVNLQNSRGESPLIIATQRRDLALVRMLVTQGADPKLPDRVAGKSARDYATDDPRGAAVLKVLEDAKPVAPAKAVAGPALPSR